PSLATAPRHSRPTRRSPDRERGADAEIAQAAVEVEAHAALEAARQQVAVVGAAVHVFGPLPCEVGRPGPVLPLAAGLAVQAHDANRKSTRLNSSHVSISYAV